MGDTSSTKETTSKLKKYEVTYHRKSDVRRADERGSTPQTWTLVVEATSAYAAKQEVSTSHRNILKARLIRDEEVPAIPSFVLESGTEEAPTASEPAAETVAAAPAEGAALHTDSSQVIHTCWVSTEEAEAEDAEETFTEEETAAARETILDYANRRICELQEGLEQKRDHLSALTISLRSQQDEHNRRFVEEFARHRRFVLNAAAEVALEEQYGEGVESLLNAIPEMIDKDLVELIDADKAAKVEFLKDRALLEEIREQIAKDSTEIMALQSLDDTIEGIDVMDDDDDDDEGAAEGCGSQNCRECTGYAPPEGSRHSPVLLVLLALIALATGFLLLCDGTLNLSHPMDVHFSIHRLLLAFIFCFGFVGTAAYGVIE